MAQIKIIFRLMVIMFFVGCGPTKDNYITSVSQSGNYSAEIHAQYRLVEIVYTKGINDEQTLDKESKEEIPKRKINAWVTLIKSPKGNVLYKDRDSRMRSRFKIYYGWDSSEQFWIYNSDNGKVWKFHFTNEWNKVLDSVDNMPKELLPHYARQKCIATGS